MSTCNCKWCAKIIPAIRWMQANAPKEHYEALNDALQHKEMAEADRDMYLIKCEEVRRLQQLCVSSGKLLRHYTSGRHECVLPPAIAKAVDDLEGAL